MKTNIHILIVRTAAETNSKKTNPEIQNRTKNLINLDYNLSLFPVGSFGLLTCFTSPLCHFALNTPLIYSHYKCSRHPSYLSTNTHT